jgi:hypothetical protein
MHLREGNNLTSRRKDKIPFSKGNRRTMDRDREMATGEVMAGTIKTAATKRLSPWDYIGDN